jgi:membrane fusion protein, heavy metal efflux system
MKTNTPYKLILAALALSVSTACSRGTKTEAEAVEVIPDDIVELRSDQIKLAGIGLGTIEYRALAGTLKVSGQVTVPPKDIATVCLPMGGYVKSIDLVPGSAVRKGQTLAVIENQEFINIQQQYLEASNKLEFAAADYKRHTDLYKENVYSEQNVQEVTTNYRNLKAEVRALEQKLALIGINPSGLTEDNLTRSVAVPSPISGFVKSVNTNIGRFAAPSDILFEIVNKDNPQLELNLFEKDAEKVSQGQKIRFFINNETEQHEAVISRTGQSVGADKTYKVYASVTGSCSNIVPGMYVNAGIESSTGEVACVPDEAIVSFDDKDYIFVFDRDKEENGKAFTEYRMIPVTRGVADGGYTEVRLPEGFDRTKAKLVVKGAYNLLSAKKNAGEMSC